MKKDELKACPFCGGKGEVFFNNANELWYVCCYDEYNDFDCCEINTTWYSNKEDAIKAWNTRTEPKEQDVCPVDKIREAFEEWFYDDGSDLDGRMFADSTVGVPELAQGFYYGYKSQQAEIERLRNKIPIVSVDGSEICFDGKGYTEDEEIERLKEHRDMYQDKAYKLTIELEQSEAENQSDIIKEKNEAIAVLGVKLKNALEEIDKLRYQLECKENN